MRIVIDMQGAQASNKGRGIGRYSIELVKALLRHRGQHEVILALNGAFAEETQRIRDDFAELLPQDNIRVWQAPGPVAHMASAGAWKRDSAALLREAFLVSQAPDVVLMTSLFEGLVDDAVTSIGMLTTSLPTAVVLYDLIPLIHRRLYLENPAVEAWYEAKLDHLRRADLLLAISDSSRAEACTHLGVAEEDCVNISAAVDPAFRPMRLEASDANAVRRRYGLTRPFVMYTGGIDHRKNVEGLIRAYALLSSDVRAKHQLAIVCRIQPEDRERLERLGYQQGLAADELILTGFVPESDLIALYNLCHLFVFPSWHEGFGLPALEAISCGRAVIAANTSSLPEVVGREDALFDPHSDAAIAAKMQEVLADDALRSALQAHGLERAVHFSWDICAQRVIAAIEALHAKRSAVPQARSAGLRRPRLAYVSPLPPERSGIADYSAELLPELSRHYQIDVIVAQGEVSDPWVKVNCAVRSVDWFRENHVAFDRVLYHFGNSHFHQHMFGLLREIPGVVVLHDFFLSGIVAHMEMHGRVAGWWGRELYESHGYRAVLDRFQASELADVIYRYPCNRSVLNDALGTVVHADYSRRLAQQWFGGEAGKDWICIPLLRVPTPGLDQVRTQSRQALGLSDDDFLVCSFGLLGPTKLNHRLVDAWVKSSLAADSHCMLVFVGENDAESEYGKRLQREIQRSGLGDRIRITGWADAELFRKYLAAADIGVQLRTLSRGETSAAVLDSMNYGLATIINANGSMADLSEDAVWKLADDFTDADFVAALETLREDHERRRVLGQRAMQIIRTRHAPRHCAHKYFDAIERSYQSALALLPDALSKLPSQPEHAGALAALAQSVDDSIAPAVSQRQLLVDISELVTKDARTGIQRVVRSVLQEWLTNPPSGYRVEPVYATKDTPGYRYARCFTLGFLGCPEALLADEPMTCRSGDVFVGLDFQPITVAAQRESYRAMRRLGVRVEFMVYDLLLFSLEHHFVDGASEILRNWLDVVVECDGVVCISRATSDTLGRWLDTHAPEAAARLRNRWFHLGANVQSSMPTKGFPADAKLVLKGLKSRPSFLMVGTLEPRKQHAQALRAFERLWSKNIDVNLVIVGKKGWMVDALASELSIHPELGRRLFWLDAISDEYLEEVYGASTCLIAASEGEGFGLPLIEAAQHQLPIIARDIPVFREVAGSHAYYFDGFRGDELAAAINEWLVLDREGKAPPSDGMPWLTWRQSVECLTHALSLSELAAPTDTEH